MTTWLMPHFLALVTVGTGHHSEGTAIMIVIKHHMSEILTFLHVLHSTLKATFALEDTEL